MYLVVVYLIFWWCICSCKCICWCARVLVNLMKPLRICTLGGQMSDLVWESKDLPLFQTFTYWGKETGILLPGRYLLKIAPRSGDLCAKAGFSTFHLCLCFFKPKRTKEGLKWNQMGSLVFLYPSPTRHDICHEYHELYSWKKIVMWRNFSFPCMTIVGKLKISPHVEKFQMSPHDRYGEI